MITEQTTIHGATARLLTVDEFEQIEQRARATGNTDALALIYHLRQVAPAAVQARRVADEQRRAHVELWQKVQQARRIIALPRSKLTKDGLMRIVEQVGEVLSGVDDGEHRSTP